MCQGEGCRFCPDHITVGGKRITVGGEPLYIVRGPEEYGESFDGISDWR